MRYATKNLTQAEIDALPEIDSGELELWDPAKRTWKKIRNWLAENPGETVDSLIKSGKARMPNPIRATRR